MALVDLFCCNGGFSLGAHRAGFRVAAAYDLDPILTSTFTANFPDTPLTLGDIGELTGASIRERVASPVTGIFGGPPCQGFSSMGRRDPGDPRRRLLGHFFRIVAEVQPAFFIMENVKGLAYANARAELDDAIGMLGNKYHVLGPLMLNAADFGAATRRERLFVVGTRCEDADPVTRDDIELHLSPAISVRDAISDLEGAIKVSDEAGFDHWQLRKSLSVSTYAAGMRNGSSTTTGHRVTEHKLDVAQRFARVPEGGIDSVGRHPRLAWSGQCPTLRAGTGSDKGSYQAVRPLHPTEPRVITVREAARLQGFPDAHKFHPTTWHSFRMIGNSVSPIMAEALFKALSGKVSKPTEQEKAA